jgi:hypothetical protein
MSIQNLFVFFMSVYFIASCQSYHIQLHGDIYKPYCGGARPTQEQEKGVVMPASYKVYIVFDLLNKQDKVLKKIELDSNGNYFGEFKVGYYALKQVEKSWSIETLKKYYSVMDTINYRYAGDKKITIWKEQLDYVFEVKKETAKSTNNFTMKENCFVGLNPCFEYIGPKPR